MRMAVKVLLATASLAVAAVASAVTRAPDVLGTTVPVAKDQARLSSGVTPVVAEDYGSTLVELAQAVRPPPPEQGLDRPGPMPQRMGGIFGGAGRQSYGQRGSGSPPFPPMDGPPGPFPAPAEMGPPPPDRRACEEGINLHAAVAGYIKSKLRLQGAQKDAWLKIEQAADPAVEKMHEACALLPIEAGGPLPLPVMIDLAEKQASARAQFLQAIRGPVQALYDTLSADQRTALNPPPPMF